MDVSPHPTLRIDIVSDIVCPWCYVGLKRFASARAQRPSVPTEVRWLPFELNPDIDYQGVDRDAYLAAKFGDLARIEGMQDHLRGIGAKLGIEFRFDLIRKTPNTRGMKPERMTSMPNGKSQRPQKTDATVMPSPCKFRKK